MQSLSAIRQHFLDYFQRLQHTVVTSAPVIPLNDPTLLFTNAGMVPFKEYFLHTAPFPKATSVQKCIRAGGKHNDLENVGFTARHHTFFEMLGNFSFGDYFKADSIEMAWRLIHQEWGLPQDKLCVTVYHEDEEAAALWRKIAGFTDDRIIRITTNDNFWSMGETGPCGPCSEIFYDHGDHIPGGPPGSLEAEGDRFVEIWNLVFMQFDQQKDGLRVPLPKPCIDTGMGLERVTAVLQGVTDNFSIDLFQHLIQAVQDITKTTTVTPSHRIIADHLRSSCFMMADGILPSNEGRGYVLRRIMRRAMRHLHLLKTTEPLMYQLVPTLIQEMGAAYPELQRAAGLMQSNLQLEEQRFQETLDKGLKLLDQATRTLPAGSMLPGDIAFKLYDTYGFPLDLTQTILQEKHVQVDEAGYDQAMQAQKTEARKAWIGSGDQTVETLWLSLKDQLPATEFLGYTAHQGHGIIQAILHQQELVDTVTTPGTYAVIIDQTPFYAESGGQMGDTGTLTHPQDTALQAMVTDTQKQAHFFVHYITLTSGSLKVGQEVVLSVDSTRRHTLQQHHSATHLLHAALRHVLGTHVTQKGSLVAPDKLRFDFSHFQALSPEEINRIEAYVNQQIAANHPVMTTQMPYTQAVTDGVMALFGEKYADDVRVVRMGQHVDTTQHFSQELCGGTHVQTTGEIGAFFIEQETGVSAGVRRIEAIAGHKVVQQLRHYHTLVRQMAQDLKCAVSALPERCQTLLQENKQLKKNSSSSTSAAHALQQTQIGTITVCFQAFENADIGTLRQTVDQYRREHPASVIALASHQTATAKVMLVVSVGQEASLDARTLIQQLTPLIGGQGGGGRMDFAQGGGDQPTGISKIYTQLQSLIPT